MYIYVEMIIDVLPELIQECKAENNGSHGWLYPSTWPMEWLVIDQMLHQRACPNGSQCTIKMQPNVIQFKASLLEDC